MNIYYVYQYLREDMTPYYIGKGSKGRAYANCRTTPKPKDKTRIQIIANKLSETEAFTLETQLIKLYGRKDLGTGILRNMTDGGDGVLGKVWTEEAKLSVSRAKTEWHKNNDISGENNPMYGKKHSKEVCEASRERALRTGFIGNRKGKAPWNKGLKLKTKDA
jgi:NUMOD3 motif